MSLRFKSEAEIPAHLMPGYRAPVVTVAQPKRTKYGNKVVEFDGYTFHSAFEAQRYRELRNSEIAGAITCLAVQPEYGLHVNGKRIGAYIADFSYFRGDDFVVEDVKSKVTKTPLYLWKKDHMKAEYDIAVQEIERNKRRRA